MFFKLKATGEKAKLISYIIVKNPENIFERTIKKRGKVISKFDKYEDNEIVYSGYIENDSLQFIKICKEENLFNYVNSEEYSVCPFNLSCIDEVFRSVLRKNKTPEISDEDYNRQYNIEFTIGPFSLYGSDFVVKLFEGCNYKVEIEREGLSYALKISGQNTISTFIQQIYVISYSLTNHLRYRVPSLQGIDKFTNLSKGWIEDHSQRNTIINRLSKIKRNMKHFETNLISETEPDQEKVKEQVNNIFDNLKTKQGEIRYRTIINHINENSSVLDFGCAKGNLIQRLLTSVNLKKLVGFDCDRKSTNLAFRRGKQILKKTKLNREVNFDVHCGSILYPDYELFQEIDTLVCSEVIEHFNKDEMNNVLNIIFKGILPNTIILTTPNKNFNVKLGMESDDIRHPDHKFEFTVDEVKEFAEMIKEKYCYSYEFLPFINDKPEDVVNNPFDQLSFVIKFTKTEESVKNNDIINKSRNIFQPFNLNISGHRINIHQVRIGSSISVRKINPNWIVSLAPTMSPADCSDIKGYLEHPSETLKYYYDRKIYDVIWETKYMGSRGTIVATKSPDISKRLFNSEETIKIYSRSGHNFFKEQETTNEIYKEVKDYMEYRGCDVIAIDCEILPWSYKAGVMIEKDFQKPGNCALLDKKFTNRDTTNEELFLKSLSNYNKKTDIEIYPFRTIIEANVNDRRKRITNVKNGYYINNSLQLFNLDDLCKNSKYFKKVNYGVMRIGPSQISGNILKFSIDELVEIWEDINKQGLEGIVVKPNYPTRFLEGGMYIQPSLKCRTRDYLRIIYGINYLDDDNLKFLKRRRAAAKRKMAMQQYELSQNILYSFIHGNHYNRLKMIFGFFGMEGVSNIDATL